MESKKTLVLGASEKPERYSNRAILNLLSKGHEVFAVGNRESMVKDVMISKQPIAVQNIDTVTVYLNETNQKPYYNYILSLKPKRIIFNPGAENEELENLASENGISVIEACTLVMLNTGQY